MTEEETEEVDDRDLPDMALVREYPGELTLAEYAFLMTLASHKDSLMWTTRERSARHMRLSVRSFDAIRKRLLDRGLIKAKTRGNKTTVYELRRRAFTEARDAYADAASAPSSEVGLNSVQRGSEAVSEVGLKQVQTEENLKHNRKHNAQPTPGGSRPARPRTSESSDWTEQVKPLGLYPNQFPSKKAQPCPGCGGAVKEGDGVWDKDDGLVWHLECSPKIEQLRPPVPDPTPIPIPDGGSTLHALRSRVLAVNS